VQPPVFTISDRSTSPGSTLSTAYRMRGWFEGWLPPPVSDAPGGLLSFTPAVEANPNRAIGIVSEEQRSTHTTPINSAHLISSAGVVQGGGGNPLLSQTLLGVHCRSPRRCGVPKMAIGLYRGSEDKPGPEDTDRDCIGGAKINTHYPYQPCPPDIVCRGGSRGGYPLLSQTLLGVIAHPRHCGEPQQGDRDCNGGAKINPHYPDQLCPPDIVCGGVVGVQTPVSMRFSSPSQIPVYPAHLISSPGGRGVQPPVSIIAIFSSYPIHPAHLISSAGVVRMGDNPLQSQTLLGVHCRSPPPLRGPGLRPIAAASPNCR